MASARGSSVRSMNSNERPLLRRPGVTMMNKFNLNEETNKIREILGKFTSSNPTDIELALIADTVKSVQDVNNFKKNVDTIFDFGLKTKWNAHVASLLCAHLKEAEVAGAKFKSFLFKKLQNSYCERNLRYTDIDAFISEIVLICEMFHHMRLEDGSCYKALAPPILDYFGMLIDGGSEKEILVFKEQVVKCYKNLKSCDDEGVKNLLAKIRKKIANESNCEISIRAMLLEMFELILTDWSPLSPCAKTFYDVMTKPVHTLCE